MITIIQGQTNRVILTLSENQTLPVSDWLFEFTNDLGNQKVIFSSSDISLNTCRYNEFMINEPLDADLPLIGFWSYRVYEMNPSSPIDLNPANAIGVVEQGKVLVKPATITVPAEFKPSSDTTPTIAFNMPD